MGIVDAYNKIKELNFPFVESLDVVEQVHEYRRYWRPDKVCVIILAESHVFTPDEEVKLTIHYGPVRKMILGYPDKFVRFVYCLGYGENDLMLIKPRNNSGTWQYWKILYACNQEGSGEINFSPILKTQNRRLLDRLRSKISLLKELREKGVWLVDSSIVGLTEYRSSLREKAIGACWDTYTRPLIEEVNPSYIFCIGQRNGRVLEKGLSSLDAPYEIISQPQDRLPGNEHEKILERYRYICSKYCS